MSLTSVVESSPLGMKANSLNRLVISSMFAKSLKFSSVVFCSSSSSAECVKSQLFWVFVLNAQSPKLPFVCCGNIKTRMSVFSTIGAATRYFPHSGMSMDSIPGNAIFRDFWEFSSDKSKTKWSVGETFIPPIPTISSYLAYSSSSFINLLCLNGFLFAKYIYIISIEIRYATPYSMGCGYLLFTILSKNGILYLLWQHN